MFHLLVLALPVTTGLLMVGSVFIGWNWVEVAFLFCSQVWLQLDPQASETVRTGCIEIRGDVAHGAV